jgi:C1A family cysteine protease
MKKNVFVLISLFAASSEIFSQQVPMLAPLNPDFVNFNIKLENGENQLPAAGEFGTGGMPPPGIISFDDYLNTNNLKSSTFAPVYDMRSLGLVTPVRGQTSNGCWAFATMATIESRWLLMKDGEWDLSENNLKFCHGFDASRSYYGNHWMSTAYFARRSGALIEGDDPNVGGTTIPGQCPSGKIPIAFITDARYLPHDMNTIKQAILEQGAIFTMMYYLAANYNSTNFTYYYNGASQVNHCVALVGWDDTKVTAGGTGAWICKNSYGAGWGESGYFYVSYNDKGILNYNAYWPTRYDNVPNSIIYGYDDLGNYQSVGYGTPEGYSLVKFVATGKQLLSKVSTYAMAANSSLEIDVFDNFDVTTKTPSGLLSHQVGLVCSMPGYYTFDLTTPITIEQGDDFYVRIRYQTPGYNNPIPIERLISGYAVPFIESDVCWMSDTGEDGSWFAIGNSTNYYKWDPCVKVYAEPLRVWNGSISSDWNSAANWLPEIVPEAGINVVIPNVQNKPSINQALATPAECNNLTIEQGSSLTINPEKALTVYGSLNNNSGNSGLVIGSGASLITKGAISGTATVNVDIEGGNWHLISPPISNAKSNIFFGKYLQKYTEATDSYTDIISENENLPVSSGFAVFNSTNFSASYSGTLNNGQIINSDNLTNNRMGWNLVGNPYPSYIDWDGSGWTKTNISNAIYLSVNSSTWASYVAGIGVNGGIRFIAPGQGFFVHVVEQSTGILAMNNSIRVHNPALFFKNPIDNLARLKISGNGYSDETVIRFLPEAKSGFDDNYDAMKLFGDAEGAAQLYSMGDIPLSINTMPETNSVELGIRTNTSGQYSLSSTESNGFGNLILEDTKTGIFTDLLLNNYTFNFTTGENEKRFILHFKPLGIIEADNSSLGIYANHNIVYIDLKDNVRGDVFITNINGQLVASALAVHGNRQISLAKPGTYIVRLITDKESLIKKICTQ